MDNGHSELEVRVLYALHILEVECLVDSAAEFGNYLVVLGYVLTLKHHGVESGLTAVVYEHRNHLDDGLGVEEVFGECDGNIGLDVAGNHFENLGIAADRYFLGAFRHLLGATAGGGDEQTCCGNHQYVKNFFHYRYFKKLLYL